MTETPDDVMGPLQARAHALMTRAQRHFTNTRATRARSVDINADATHLQQEAENIVGEAEEIVSLVTRLKLAEVRAPVPRDSTSDRVAADAAKGRLYLMAGDRDTKRIAAYARELCYEIEKLPASTQQTDCSIRAASLSTVLHSIAQDFDIFDMLWAHLSGVAPMLDGSASGDRSTVGFYHACDNARNGIAPERARDEKVPPQAASKVTSTAVGDGSVQHGATVHIPGDDELRQQTPNQIFTTKAFLEAHVGRLQDAYREHRGGIKGKFYVSRVDDAAQKRHEACWHWVLDVADDPNALPALEAYAKSCERTFPRLAAQLRQILNLKKAGWKGPFISGQNSEGWRMDPPQTFGDRDTCPHPPGAGINVEGRGRVCGECGAKLTGD